MLPQSAIPTPVLQTLFYEQEAKERRSLKVERLTETIIGAAIAVHKALGPGLLESAYHACMAYEMAKQGLRVVAQQPLPIIYGELRIECAYRMDFLVEDEIIVEIKGGRTN